MVPMFVNITSSIFLEHVFILCHNTTNCNLRVTVSVLLPKWHQTAAPLLGMKEPSIMSLGGVRVQRPESYGSSSFRTRRNLELLSLAWHRSGPVPRPLQPLQ